MSRWFRVYADMVDDPKVQRLPADLFKALVNLWCLAAHNDGTLPCIEDVAFKLRVDEKTAGGICNSLVAAGLLDVTETGTIPHNWSGRQYKSDVSNERVKRHRQQKRNVTPAVTETPPDTDTDTDTEAAQHTGTPREAEPPPKPPEPSPTEFPNIPWALIRDPEKNDRLETALREAAGLENDISSGLFDLSPMVELIDKGWSLPKLILPKLREMKAKGKRGSTWRYYVPAIVEAQQANAAIPANHQPAKVATTWVTEDDPRWPDLAARYQREKGRVLSPTGSRHRPGMGYEFPADWLEQEAA